MRLDFELLINIMAYIESTLGFKSILPTAQVCFALQKDHPNIYSESQVKYAIAKLEEAGFIKLDERKSCIEDISWEGHVFINKFRTYPNWGAYTECKD
ncbi:hypothetical protein CS063_17210 [Sporanaerobium hydrogeniformans]|uniref:Uncharacterized protein n=1 Tax=Sporanaerobium hydrogeniformans TaxID=3072179 RepID=A0AC61D8U4_9FIRM|nr:DUF2513 domain-containing protein [Sporanaerobium hydrogeniformans]PHV69190.1 hypothetical protein CS063_17210 [Sporanaerobium hydrogeniformans]